MIGVQTLSLLRWVHRPDNSLRVWTPIIVYWQRRFGVRDVMRAYAPQHPRCDIPEDHWRGVSEGNYVLPYLAQFRDVHNAASIISPFSLRSRPVQLECLVIRSE